jgi:ABC-2 type transport system ATP-binding protein
MSIAQGEQVQPDAPAIQLDRISKLYGRTVALRSITLELGCGSTLALLGSNGSGKTTLLKILAGATTATLGSARIFGHDLASDRASLRPLIGLMAPETYLYDDLTSFENLQFILTLAGNRSKEESISNALARVGLGGHAAERVRTFSSGMKRRLCLARTLLLEPRLILLDEPYNSLDEAAADLVDDVVREAVAGGRAVVLATHDAERALALADRVAMLDRGALTYVGPARPEHVENGVMAHAEHVG